MGKREVKFLVGGEVEKLAGVKFLVRRGDEGALPFLNV